MGVDASLRSMMDAIDDHSESMGSGAYCALARHVMKVSDSMTLRAERAKRALATDMIVDQPSCISNDALLKYTTEPVFMQGVVRAKVRSLADYGDLAQKLGYGWKVALAESLIPREAINSGSMLPCVREGIMSLLLSRSSFLDQIVKRLNDIRATPQMLFPKDYGVAPQVGDCGYGPSARDLLHHEPRLIRWLLNRDPLSPWPVVGTPLTQPRYELRLIRCADAEGGDDRTINSPCTCPTCRGERVPTMTEDGAASLTPSEYDPEEGLEELHSPPPTPPRLSSPTRPSPPRRAAAVARSTTLPYARP